MDPYKLLARSTKLSKRRGLADRRSTPSSGDAAQVQLFSTQDSDRAASRKRKRGADVPDDHIAVDFFGAVETKTSKSSKTESKSQLESDDSENGLQNEEGQHMGCSTKKMTVEKAKSILRMHKLKTTWLNPAVSLEGHRRKSKDKIAKEKRTGKISLYPQPLQEFNALHTQYRVSARLTSNIEELGYSVPTEVQMGALPLLLEKSATLFKPHALPEPPCSLSGIDLLTVAPTGSGKTLAFMIPLLCEVGEIRRASKERAVSALILAPTKELVGQIVNEGNKLAQRTGVKISQVRKGTKLVNTSGSGESDGNVDDTVKSDVLVSTPGVLATSLQEISDHESSALSTVRYLILDEADVLLDPLFRQQTLAIWSYLPSFDLRVSLWSATMGSNIEELAVSTIQDRRAHLSKVHKREATSTPVVRLVVGLKDSAVPNVNHKLVYAASEQGKLMGLRQLLHPTTNMSEAGSPLLPPFLVFTQTIERAVALHSELLYDIPAEAGGIGRIAVLHSDLSDTARDSVMTRFRKGEIWVLITTDLLARGVDFRGVNGVVNYDIPTSAAAYVHRVGRTGRAGREGGVAVTLYSKEDIPFLKPIATLIATAQKLKETSDTGEIQSWLLNSLPTLSKKVKQGLKKRGIESRTARGRQKDAQAARKAKISTKAGYVRREENKRKGAILGSQRRQESEGSEGEETDFGGFS